MMKSYLKYLYLIILTLVWGCTSAGDLLANDYMHFSYKVMDENGKPIPYVSILGRAEPKDTQNNVDLQLDDIRYFVEKFTDNEMFIIAGFSPINTLHVRQPTDEFGKGTYSINYGDNYWRGIRKNTQRFVFIKRGYEPSYWEYKYKKGDDDVLFNVVLKRRKVKQAFSPLLAEFDRLRYQLERYKPEIHVSNISSNSEIKKVSQNLVNLAWKAEATKDYSLAAMVFLYASESPSVIRQLKNGISVKGYSRGGDNPQSLELKNMALNINRTEPNLLLMKLRRDNADNINVYIPEPVVLSDYLKKMEAIIIPKKGEVSPPFHRHYIHLLRSGKKFRKACLNAIWFDEYYKSLSANTKGSTAVEGINSGIILDKKLGFLPPDENFKCTLSGDTHNKGSHQGHPLVSSGHPRKRQEKGRTSIPF